MTRSNYLARTAGSAIAAALALASTPLLAQEVSTPATQPQTTPDIPAVIVPATPPPVTQATPTVLPSAPAETATPQTSVPSTAATQQPVMRSAPVVQQVPEPEASAEATPEEQSPAPVAATRPQAPARSSVSADPEPVPASAPADDVAPANAVLPATPLPLAEPAPAAEPSAVTAAPVDQGGQPTDSYMAWLLAGLGVAGLALLALLLKRRRREPPVEKIQPYRAAAADPVATVGAGGRRDAGPAQAASVSTAPVDIATARASSDLETPLPTAGASTPLPRRKPATVEARKALIDKIASAKPDRANPFRSIKARRRRARLIVQSLDDAFPNGSRIDFSQYPAKWPHLARGAQTAAA